MNSASSGKRILKRRETSSGQFFILGRLQNETPCFESKPFLVQEAFKIHIDSIDENKLTAPIIVAVQFDQIHYLAECIEIPIYATGLTVGEAIINLKDQILELYHELLQEEDLSEEWVRHKNYLKDRFASV